MKKLKFEKDTIVPFWLKDLEYMQEGIEEALKGIVEGLSLDKKDMLISGCEITYKDGKISMTQGWFYHKGEILPVEALPESDCENDSPTVYLEKVIEYSDSGDRKIVNKQGEETASPYEKIYLKPTLLPTGDIEVKQGDLGLVKKIVANYQADDASLKKKMEQSYQAGDASLKKDIIQMYGEVDSEFKEDVMFTPQVLSTNGTKIKHITKGHITQIFGVIYFPTPDVYREIYVDIDNVPSPLQDIRIIKHTVYQKNEVIIDITKSDKKMRITGVNISCFDGDMLYLDDIMYFSGGNI